MLNTHSSLSGRPTLILLPSDQGWPLWLGATDAARARNVNLLHVLIEESCRSEYFRKTVLSELVNSNIADGIALWPGMLRVRFDNFDHDALDAFVKQYAGRPLVTYEAVLPGIPAILTDVYQGMRELLIHLIEQHGYRRILLVRGPEGHFETQERCRAYHETLPAYGLPLEPQLISPPTPFGIETGGEMMAWLMDERGLRPGRDVDVIVTTEIHYAISIFHLFHARGISIPDDVALASFDDNEEARYMLPPITRVGKPFYGVGWQMIESLLTQLGGGSVPDVTTLPTELLIGQSCGCVDPLVMQAATPLMPRRETIAIAPREDVALPDAAAIASAAGVAPETIAQVVEAFVAEVEHAGRESFLSVLNKSLRQSVMAGGEVLAWQNVISKLQREVIAELQERASIWHGMGLCQQARVMIGAAEQRVQATQRVNVSHRTQALLDLGAELISTFDIAQLMDVLARGLPRLNIPACYLALFEQPDNSVEWARLRLAYHEAGRIACDSDAMRFRSRELTPAGLLSQDREMTMILEFLNFQADQIGFALFEVGPREGRVYAMLRSQISSALQGALLVNRVQEHAAEIARLNEQLQDENLRMKAEMELARRIQTALLPQSVRNLHPDFEIAAIMLPAEEVGGDYYDITFDRQGNLWLGIGDVSGHGMTPGLISMMAQTVHTTITTQMNASPKDVVIATNKILYKNVHERLQADEHMTFTTLKYLGSGAFSHAGAHLDLIVHRRAAQTCELIDTPGVYLNFVEDISEMTDESSFSLDIGDTLLLYTDGLTEAMNAARDLFSERRFLEIIQTHADLPPEAMRDAILRDILDWSGGIRDDDMTLMVVRRVR